MSLESEIEKLTSAVLDLVKAIGDFAAIHSGRAVPPSNQTQPATVEAEKPKRGRPAKKDAEPEPEPPPVPATEKAQAIDDKLSHEAIGAIMKKVYEAKGRDTVVSILKQFGASRVTEIKAEQLADAKKAFESA